MYSNEILSYIICALRLKQDDKEHDAFYGEYKLGENDLIVRVSNHRTHLKTWDEKYEQINDKTFYSFVFEDGDTVGNTEVPSGSKIIVNETVYKSTDLNLENLRNIKNAINQLSKTGYYNVEALNQFKIITNKE